jgi:hypothetical protein
MDFDRHAVDVELRTDSDLDGAAVWRRIMDAVAELANTTPTGPVRTVVSTDRASPALQSGRAATERERIIIMTRPESSRDRGPHRRKVKVHHLHSPQASHGIHGKRILKVVFRILKVVFRRFCKSGERQAEGSR